MSGSAQTLPGETVDYVVQVKMTLMQGGVVNGVSGEPLEVGGEKPYWIDVATVTVPPKTKRKTALRQGLAEAGIELTPELEARVLDPDSAYVWKALPPEPKALRLA